MSLLVKSTKTLMVLSSAGFVVKNIVIKEGGRGI